MKIFKLIFNPFERIAGYEALVIGIIGIAVSSLLSFLTKTHANGMLNYGPGSDNEFWVFAVENIVRWLVPAMIFYVSGFIFTKSHIRIVEVLGTTAFAKLPLVAAMALFFTPPMRDILSIDASSLNSVRAIVENINIVALMFVSSLLLFFIVWSFIWLYNAMSVSCNLKGVKGDRNSVVYGNSVGYSVDLGGGCAFH